MKTMLLEEAIRQGVVTVGDSEEGILGNYIKYEVGNKECVIPTELTGWKEKQIFKTEQLGWRLERVGDEVLLIADEATELELWLEGKIGYEHGIEAMNYLCEKLYRNPLADKVIAMTEEIVNGGVSSCKRSYWLGSSYVYTSTAYTFFGIYYASNIGNVYDYALHFSYGDAGRHCLGVRPVVSLKSNLQVVISEQSNGSKEKPWQVIENISENPSNNP